MVKNPTVRQLVSNAAAAAAAAAAASNVASASSSSSSITNNNNTKKPKIGVVNNVSNEFEFKVLCAGDDDDGDGDCGMGNERANNLIGDNLTDIYRSLTKAAEAAGNNGLNLSNSHHNVNGQMAKSNNVNNTNSSTNTLTEVNQILNKYESRSNNLTATTPVMLASNHNSNNIVISSNNLNSRNGGPKSGGTEKNTLKLPIKRYKQQQIIKIKIFKK